MAAGNKIKKEHHNGISILRVSGRLDAITAPKLEEALDEYIAQEAPRVLIDFGQVDYLSSAGMRLLLATTKKLDSKGGKLALCMLHDDVMEIIRMAGFEKILHIRPSEHEAIESLQ